MAAACPLSAGAGVGMNLFADSAGAGAGMSLFAEGAGAGAGMSLFADSSGTGAGMSLFAEGGAAGPSLLELIANDDAEGTAAALLAGAKWSVLQIGSPLHAAATYGAAACAARLLADGAAVDAPNKDGHTALHLAAVEGSEEVVRLLLAAGADALAKTCDVRVRVMRGGVAIDAPGGRTALHLAAAHANLGAARALLEARPEAASVEDLDGATPRDVALREGALGQRLELPPARWAVAQLLAPDTPVPPMPELRKLAEADMKRRRDRGDAAERVKKRAIEEATLAASLPTTGGYKPGDQELYGLPAASLSGLLAPELAAALAEADAERRAALLRGLMQEITPGVLAFRLFPAGSLAGDGQKDGLGQRLLAEITAIEAWANSTSWQLKRPNSMNRYGVVLRDVGLGDLVAALASAVTVPLATLLWPERAAGGLEDLHAFTVRYRGGEDRRLDTHMDSSEVTLNVCLGGEFRGGGVYFHGLNSENGGDHGDPIASPHPADCPHCRATHPHEPGVALIHLGEHIHGAHNIEQGERTNLVLWCRKQS